MHDQHANLKRTGIESVLFIDSSLTPDERRRAQEMMKAGERQFVFISPERLQIQRFRDHLSSLDVPVSYCVVDEAHCVSEWGHDFRTAYLRLGPNARTHCPSQWKRLPIIALTGTASFDVLADVRRELGFGEETETVTPESMEREELEFEIVRVSPPEVDEDADPWEVKKAVFEQKKRALPSVLQEMPDWFEESASGEDDSSEESSRQGPAQNGSGNGRDDFFELKGDQTRSGLIFTPHANGDFGVQSLANEAKKGVPPLRGRVGTFASSDRDQEEEDRQEVQEEYKENELSALVATKAFGMGIDKPNIRYVVHMNMSQSIESYYQQAGRAGRDGDPARCAILYCDQEVPAEDPEEESAQDAAPGDTDTITVDQELLRFFHNSSFKGPEKEKRIVYDLLTGDADPDGEAPDLQALVQNMESGDHSEAVAIKFENREVIEEITSYLSQKADQGFNRRIVSLACERARSGDELPKKLKWAYKKIRDDWPEWGALDGHEDWLASRFQRLRDRQDTFRAVYRLSTIGLIGDYTVDYNAGVIRADIQNLGAAGFIQELQEYIGRYVAPERAREIPEEVMQHSGQNVIQKCLGYLVDFVYETIAQKRKMAASVMEEAIQEGINQGDEAFRRRVNTYFDSRYLPVLQRRVQDREFDLELVWEFIEETGGADDDVNHLRGACDRLLSEYTENGALYLLRAYTRCLMEGGRLEEFREDFREGWRLFREVKGLSRAEYLRALSKYRNLLSELDNRLQGALDEEIAQAHASWLREFNREFLAAKRS
jgi:ATP-dependent DNA helicase RecQ